MSGRLDVAFAVTWTAGQFTITYASTYSPVSFSSDAAQFVSTSGSNFVNIGPSGGWTTLNYTLATAPTAASAALWLAAVQALDDSLVFDNLTLEAASNQLTIQPGGSGFSYIWNLTNPAADRTITMDDPGANAKPVMTQGAQTIAGNKTFSNSTDFNSDILVADFIDFSSTVDQLKVTDGVDIVTYTLPPSSGGALTAEIISSIGAQTITGTKTFSGIIATNGTVTTLGSTTGTITTLGSTTATIGTMAGNVSFSGTPVFGAMSATSGTITTLGSTTATITTMAGNANFTGTPSFSAGLTTATTGGTAATFNHYETPVAETITFTGAWAGDLSSARMTKLGNRVTLYWSDSFKTTASAASLVSSTNLTSRFRPLVNFNQSGLLGQDNSATALVTIRVNTTGQVEINLAPLASFTNSGMCGIYSGHITYIGSA